MTIAITGATGALGGRVARLLAADPGPDAGPLRLVVRDAARAPDLGRPVDVRTATYADGTACEAALEGVSTLLLVSAAESATRRDEHRAVIAAAGRAGVDHVVYTSFVSASPDAAFSLARDHADAEAALAEVGAETGAAVTLLRDNFYADVLPHFFDEAGVIRGPAGHGTLAAVARADVADAAAAILRDPEPHRGATYAMTGPQAVGLAEVAARAGAALGRDLRYEEETLDEAWASRRAAFPDADDFLLDAWVSTYTAIADGSLAEVGDDVERLAGHPARTLEEAWAG